jgi:hypothetical protein
VRAFMAVSMGDFEMIPTHGLESGVSSSFEIQ